MLETMVDNDWRLQVMAWPRSDGREMIENMENESRWITGGDDKDPLHAI